MESQRIVERAFEEIKEMMGWVEVEQQSEIVEILADLCCNVEEFVVGRYVQIGSLRAKVVELIAYFESPDGLDLHFHNGTVLTYRGPAIEGAMKKLDEVFKPET